MFPYLKYVKLNEVVVEREVITILKFVRPTGSFKGTFMIEIKISQVFENEKGKRLRLQYTLRKQGRYACLKRKSTFI